MLDVITVGLNHKTAAVELRERLAFSKTRLSEAYSLLHNFPSILEGLILSTCNRVEVYAVVHNPEKAIEELKEFLSSYHGIGIKEFECSLYVYLEPESICHLFKVASGLDSMVLGETQIFGQLKKAYLVARQNNSLGRVLEPILQRAFSASKKVRSFTNIAKGPVSVSSVAVKLAEQILGDLSQRKVMVMGVGKVSELAVKYLMLKGASSILVSNRTYEKAACLARRYGGRAVRFNEFLRFLAEVDIVISSTSAPHLLLRKEDVLPIMKERQKRPLFFVDVAVPRDIEPEVGHIQDVYLYDIDDLEKIADRNIQLRKKEVDKCKQIIRDEVSEFINSFGRNGNNEIFLPRSAAAKEEKEEMVVVCG